MNITRLSTQCPAIPAAAGFLSLASARTLPTGNAPTSPRFAAGDGATVRPSLNEFASRSDLLARYGGGQRGIAYGLGITAATGLSVTLAVGHALVDGIVEVSASQTVAVIGSSWNYLWLRQDGSIQVQTNTLSAPVTTATFIGAVQTNGSAVTLVDHSGVVFLQSGFPVRFTADTNAPADTPPSEVMLIGKTVAGYWFANGGVWYPLGIPDASITTAKLANGAVTNPKLADDAVDARVIAVTPVNGYLLGWDGSGNLVAVAPGGGGGGGSVAWADVTGKPSTFTPSAHASSHAPAGSDPISPASIGAANAVHTHSATDITDFPDSLPPSAHAASHAAAGSDPISPASIGAAPTSHTHDDRYYTETEIDSLLSGKSNTGHTHAATAIVSGTLDPARVPILDNAHLGDDSVDARVIAVTPVNGYLLGWDSGGALVAVAPGGGGGGSVAWTDITGKPSTFAPSAHASSHATGGADELEPGDIGAAEATHTHDAADITSGTLDAARLPAASTSAAGIVELATDGESTSGVVVQGNDSRLSDARTPVSHTHNASDINAGTLAAARLPAATTSVAGAVELATDGENAANVVVQGNDARLSDARTPTSHNHNASDINAGTLAAARLPAATTSAQGAVELATSAETTAGLAVQASDTRLSDSRAPTGSAGGDLSSTYPNPTVAKLQGRAVHNGAPADGNALVWSAANSRWQPGSVSGGSSTSVVNRITSDLTIDGTDDIILVDTTTSPVTVTLDEDAIRKPYYIAKVAGTNALTLITNDPGNLLNGYNSYVFPHLRCGFVVVPANETGIITAWEFAAVHLPMAFITHAVSGPSYTIPAAALTLLINNSIASSSDAVLPLAAKWRGHRVRVLKTDNNTNPIQVVAASGDTLACPTGANILDTQYDSIELESDGSTWWAV